MLNLAKLCPLPISESATLPYNDALGNHQKGLGPLVTHSTQKEFRAGRNIENYLAPSLSLSVAWETEARRGQALASPWGPHTPLAASWASCRAEGPQRPGPFQVRQGRTLQVPALHPAPTPTPQTVSRILTPPGESPPPVRTDLEQCQGPGLLSFCWAPCPEE